MRLRIALLSLAVLAAGFAHAQQIVGWGTNYYSLNDIPKGIGTTVQALAGVQNNVALSLNGTVHVWGRNDYGQNNVPAGLTGVVSVADGFHTLAVKSDGTVVAWGYNNWGETDVPAGLSGVTQVATGYYHSLALKSDGTVVAWGYNGSGQCNVPAGLTGVVKIGAAGFDSIALKSDGTVVVWGDNTYGELNVPAGLSGVTQVAGGLYHFAALKANGTVVAWGSNYYGQCNVPAGLTGVTQVAAGDQHNLALKSDGSIVGWGADTDGELDIPAGLPPAVGISAFGLHSLALLPVGVQLDQSYLYSGGVATGTVTLLNAPGAGGTNIALSAEDPSVHVPSSVFVPQGAHTATFPVTTDVKFSNSLATHVYAIRSGYTYSTVLDVYGQRAYPYLTQSSIVGGSTSGPAFYVSLFYSQATDLTLDLASSDLSVTVPATITIPAGQTSARVFPRHSLVPFLKSADLTVSYQGNVVATTTLTVRPVTGTLAFVPNIVVGGTTATAVLQLSAAMANAYPVALSSGDTSLVQVPASVTVDPGDKNALFAVTTASVDKPTYVPVTATVNGIKVVAQIRLMPIPALSVLSVPTFAYGNQIVQGTVILRAPAVAGGTTVTLSKTGPISIPASVFVAAGQSQATFPIGTTDVASDTASTVTATAGPVTITKNMTVRRLAISSMYLSNQTTTGGNSVSASVTLNTTVDVDTVVSLSSDNAAYASVPATVTIPAGSQSANFTVTTTHHAATKNVRITVGKNGTSAYRTLKVTP